MVKIKSVKVNFIMNMILTASTFIFPLITLPYITRVLSVEGVGKVNVATSIAQYFSMVAMLGVPTYGIRACAQVRDDREKLTKTVQEILLLNLLISVFVYAAYFVAIWKVPKIHNDAALYWIMSSTIIFNVIGVEWLYKGLEQYTYITVRSIIFKAIGLVLMFLFVRHQGDYVIYGAISIVATVGSNFLNFINLRKYVNLRPVGHYDLKHHFKEVMIFFAMAAATTIYTNLDNVMLGFLKNETQAGYYGTSIKIKGLLVSFVTALSTVLLPRVSYYIERGMKEEFKRVSRKALHFVVLLALPVTVYFILYSRESIFLLASKTYENSIIPMQIIMPTVLLIGLTNVLGLQIMVPIGKEKMVFYSVLAGGIADFVANMIFIPTMSEAGAALGTLIAETVVLIVQLIVLRDWIRDLFSEVQWVKACVSTAVAGVACYGVKALNLSNFIALVISVCVFGAVYAVLLLIMREPLFLEVLQDVLHGKVKRGKAEKDGE